MKIRSLVAFGCLAGFLLACVANASATGTRGFAVKVRASDSPDAPVTDEVQLYGDSHALIIGIDNYKNGWPRLSKAVEDAKLIAAAMKKRGFDVQLLLNPDGDALNKAFEEFFVVKGEKADARLFVWFAGHGYTERGEGFLVPADAPLPEKRSQFRLTALALRRIGEYVRMAEAKHAFAVFDSCFSGTVFESARALPPRAVTRATTLPVRQFLTSGDAGQTVSDNGTFRELFLRAINGEEHADANDDGYLTASELGLFLTDRITNLTQSKQTPRYGKLRDKDWDRGDFVFVLPSAATPTPVAKAAPGDAEAAKIQQESLFWESIKDSGDPATYQAYLKQYPKGTFAALAKVKLNATKTTVTAQRGLIEAERKRLEEERARFAADAERIRQEQANKLSAQMEAERKRIETERAALARQQQLALATPSGQPTAEPHGDFLKGFEIKLLVVDNRGRQYKSSGAGFIDVKFKDDGRMSGTNDKGNSDFGKWWIEDNRLCRRWEEFNRGRTGCFEITISGNVATFYGGGGVRKAFTMEFSDIPAAFKAARQ